MKATCKVATDSKQIEVVLPVVPSNLFTGIDVEAQGASNQTDFNINLTECSNTDDQKIEFRFTGTADSANKTLANEVEGSTDADNSGNAGATGVGIRIYSKGTTNNGLINLNTTAAEGAPPPPLIQFQEMLRPMISARPLLQVMLKTVALLHLV